MVKRKLFYATKTMPELTKVVKIKNSKIGFKMDVFSLSKLIDVKLIFLSQFQQFDFITAFDKIHIIYANKVI